MVAGRGLCSCKTGLIQPHLVPVPSQTIGTYEFCYLFQQFQQLWQQIPSSLYIFLIRGIGNWFGMFCSPILLVIPVVNLMYKKQNNIG